MRLRRKHILEAKADRTFQKCLAIAIILKRRLKTSRIHKYSLNKMSKAAGISHRTAKKYERWLLEYGLIHFEGTQNNKVLIVNSISSHTTNRNIRIEEMDFSSFFTVYRSLQSFLFMRIQHNKDFIQQLLQARHEPESPEEFKAAKRKVRKLVEQGVLDSVDSKYVEYGLSLKRLSKEVGCCVKTIQSVVKYAIAKQWAERQHHSLWVYAPKVNGREIPGFTFSTRHMMCIVHPNTYVLSPAITEALSY